MGPEGEEERGGGEEGRRGWITKGLQLSQQLIFTNKALCPERAWSTVSEFGLCLQRLSLAVCGG